MKDTGKLRWALGLFVALSFAAVGVACDDDGDDKPGVDAAVDAIVNLDSRPVDAASVPFGATCGTGYPACTGATNYCAKFPTTALTGQCTFYGCGAMPGVCPAADPCNDVSLYIKTMPPAAPIPPNTFICVAKEKLQAYGDAGAGNDGGNKDGGDASSDAAGDAQKD